MKNHLFMQQYIMHSLCFDGQHKKRVEDVTFYTFIILPFFYGAQFSCMSII